MRNEYNQLTIKVCSDYIKMFQSFVPSEPLPPTPEENSFLFDSSSEDDPTEDDPPTPTAPALPTAPPLMRLTHTEFDDTTGAVSTEYDTNTAMPAPVALALNLTTPPTGTITSSSEDDTTEDEYDTDSESDESEYDTDSESDETEYDTDSESESDGATDGESSEDDDEDL